MLVMIADPASQMRSTGVKYSCGQQVRSVSNREGAACRNFLLALLFVIVPSAFTHAQATQGSQVGMY